MRTFASVPLADWIPGDSLYTKESDVVSIILELNDLPIIRRGGWPPHPDAGTDTGEKRDVVCCLSLLGDRFGNIDVADLRGLDDGSLVPPRPSSKSKSHVSSTEFSIIGVIGITRKFSIKFKPLEWHLRDVEELQALESLLSDCPMRSD